MCGIVVVCRGICLGGGYVEVNGLYEGMWGYVEECVGMCGYMREKVLASTLDVHPCVCGVYVGVTVCVLVSVGCGVHCCACVWVCAGVCMWGYMGVQVCVGMWEREDDSVNFRCSAISIEIIYHHKIRSAQ